MSSALLAVLTAWCRARGLPDPEDEYPFHPTRKWRWDYAFPTLSPPVAIEIDGGLYVQGRHSQGAGREKDLEKHAEGIALGWVVLVVSPRMVNDGRLLAWLERLVTVERGG